MKLFNICFKPQSA